MSHERMTDQMNIVTDAETFGGRLRRVRRSRGMSQVALAARTGVTSANLSNIELGIHLPSLMLLERLADVFGVTMDELWRGTGRCEAEAPARA